MSGRASGTDGALAQARAIADTVLYEGYVLYPYTASSRKNQVRFQFGVISPLGADADGAGEGATMQTECLLEPGATATLDIGVRFLQVQSRQVQRAEGADFVSVDRLDVGDQGWVPWDETVEQRVEVVAVPVGEFVAAERTVPIDIPGGDDVEELRRGDGSVAGRLVRRRWALDGAVRLSAERVAGTPGLIRLRVRIENYADYVDGGRSVALRRSFVAAHTMLAVHDGSFESLLDPAEHTAAAAAACVNERTWPVLVGAEDERSVMLSAPIILHDYPEIAPESPGDLYDATEIDEILTLRIMTLTEEEKREARATDDRAAAVVERSDDLPPEIFDRLHGVIRGMRPVADVDLDPIGAGDAGRGPVMMPMAGGAGDDSDGIPMYGPGMEEDRPAFIDPATTESGERLPWWDPGVDASVSPGSDSVRIGEVEVAAGSRVRLRPLRRADAHDLFLAERTARVAAVYFDVDDETHVAVVLEDDPGADIKESHGRYLYFAPEELEPLPDDVGGAGGLGDST